MLKTLSNFGLSRSHYIVMAIETFKSLSWEHTYISPNGCKALIWTNTVQADGRQINIPTEIVIEITLDTPRLQLNAYQANSTTNEHDAHPPLADVAASYQKFIEEYQDTFVEIYPQFNLQQLDEKWAFLAKSYFKNATASGSTKRRLASFEEIKRRIIQPFIPKEQTLMTNVLFYSNIVVYILMVLAGVHFWNPTVESLVAWGANNKELVLNDGQSWRLLSSCFLHVGLLHLVFNMYALVLLGFFVEPFLGRWRYLIAYLAAGIAGSALSIYWNDWATVSAGASGAISGIAGMLMVLLLFQFLGEKASRLLFMDMLLIIGLNFFIGFADNIDNAAHGGGFVVGAVFGLFYALTMKEELKNYKPQLW